MEKKKRQIDPALSVKRKILPFPGRIGTKELYKMLVVISSTFWHQYRAARQMQTAMKNISPLKIFLVDYDLFSSKMYELHLGVIGYKGIRLYQDEILFLDDLTEQPDVIFLNYNMDNLSNPALLKKIKRFDPDIYVIFLCNRENKEETANALKNGAFDFIVKGENDLDSMKKMLKRISAIKELLNRNEENFIRKIF